LFVRIVDRWPAESTEGAIEFSERDVQGATKVIDASDPVDERPQFVGPNRKLNSGHEREQILLIVELARLGGYALVLVRTDKDDERRCEQIEKCGR